MGEEITAQRGTATVPKSHSKWVVEFESNIVSGVVKHTFRWFMKNLKFPGVTPQNLIPFHMF